MQSDKLQKIRALYERATTEGERQAAAAAMDRLQCGDGAPQSRSSANRPKGEQPRRYTFAIKNRRDRELLKVLCIEHGAAWVYGGEPSDGIVILEAPRRLLKNILWPQFQQLRKVIRQDASKSRAHYSKR